MMLKILSFALLATTTTAHAVNNNNNGMTTVAVVELGKGGSVRQTTSTSPHATVRGVTSFWANLHDMDPHGRRAKRVPPAGMSMVPDFFEKANGGLIVGFTGLHSEDIHSMPTLQAVLDKNVDHVIGEFHLSGSQANALMRHDGSHLVQDTKEFETKLGESVQHIVSSPKEENKVKTISLDFQHYKSESSIADQSLSQMFHALKKQADASDSTFVVHLVIEQEGDRIGADAEKTQEIVEQEDEEHQQHRRLEEQEQRNTAEQGKSGSIYYGYGYYDANGEWYTPYRTISQIQYFQVSLWAAVGLFAILCLSLSKMFYMPLIVSFFLYLYSFYPELSYGFHNLTFSITTHLSIPFLSSISI